MAEYLNNNKDDDDDDEYRDNPSKILAVTVTYDDDENKLFPSMKDVVRVIVSSWSCLSDDDIMISKLSGGITNIIYLLRKKNNNDSNSINTTMNPNAVIVRIYGDGTDIVIDRNIENTVFASLSSLRIGPVYYGRFQNGRVEGYLSARSLTMEEMCDPSLHPRTAYAIAQLHAQQVHNIDTSISVYTKVCKNIEIAKTLKFDDPHKRKLYERLNLSLIESELKGLNDYLYELMEDGLDLDINFDDGKKHFASWHRAGIKLAMDITLCHNDLLSGNILLSHELISFLDTDPSVRDDSHFNDTAGISLIDYEYAGYDYRGYDIANHFCEFGGFDFNIKEHFPKFETRATFIYHYICAVANRKDTSLLRLDSGTRAAISYISSLTIGNIFNNEETLTFFLAVDSVIRPMCLLAHLYWGVWSIIQSRYSPVVDFEYLDYAHQRLNGYFYHKDEFNLNF